MWRLPNRRDRREPSVRLVWLATFAGLGLISSARADTLPGSAGTAVTAAQPASVSVQPAASPKDGDTEDLTQLSLEQLLQLDIVGINVLGSHTHLERELMVGYRYMNSDLSGYLDGDHRLSNRQVLRRFPTLHTSMSMEMHMLELMYAPSDTLTVMGMLPYHQMSMQHLRRTGDHFPTESEGFGDVTFMATQTLLGNARKGESRLLFNGGISFPTGSITQRDDTPSARRAILEYPMQLGSGTVNLLPGLTWVGQSSHWAWGGQALANVPLGRNSRGYRFGNQYHLGAWASYKVKDWLSPSVRLDLRRRENIEGRDPELDPRANPESDPKLQAGTKLYLVLGLNFFAPKGTFKGQRLTLEGGIPLYQSLSGPQLSDNWQVSLGWTYTFKR